MTVIRWRNTLEWRRQHKVDMILEMPHPKFDVIKQHYPHFFHKKTKQGYAVYFERAGGIDMEGMMKRGITLDDLLHHYIFITGQSTATVAQAVSLTDC